MKKLLVLILAAVLTLSLAACGGEDEQNHRDEEPPVTAGAQEEKPPQEPDPIEKKEAEEESAPGKEEEPVPEEEPAPEALPVLTAGESVAVGDQCEFCLDYVNITADVMPPQPGSWYSHYEADAGKVYVDVCIAYKNLKTGKIGADEVMSGTLVYNGKYEYTGFPVIEKDSRGDFTYANITSIDPLSTEYLHYLFEVPQEVQDGAEALEAVLTIAGEDYLLPVRAGATGEAPVASTADTKTGGEVALGETVATQNAEFSVDYANITADVMPPQPGSWYSHYEAEAGKVYVDFCVAYKNTSGQNAGADDVLTASLKYAGKYDYTGFPIIEKDSRGDFTYANITSIAPLSTEYLHYLFEVPQEVESSAESITITFRIDGNEYLYTVR